MADFQRVIEFLRDVRQGGLSNLQAGNEEIAQMAAQYAALCAQTNERLRQCSAFLQQGLRTEAIHLAEQPPNLLDLVSQLDLPDPQAWAEFCQNNGLPVPPPLQFDRATQLNDAYAQDQPLEHLLAHHRYLALARAPIRDRLQTMRKIAQIDAGNAQWMKDLGEMEAARMNELPTVFYNAVKNHDDKAIINLMDEVNRQPWQQPPPVDLATAVAEAYGRIQRASAEAQLQQLVEPLRDAFAARSLQECQALVQRWKNIMASAGVTQVSPELMDEIKPVAAFVNEQTKREDLLRRFQEATKAFTRLLDTDAPDIQLEAAYARLKEFKEEIPEGLVRRYMNRKAERRQVADRKHKRGLLIIAGIAACVMAIAGIVAWLYVAGANADKWARRISDAVAEHSKKGLDEAQASVDQLKQTSPGLITQPKVATAINGLAALKSEYERDQQSAAALAQRLATAQASAEKALSSAAVSTEELGKQGDQLDAVLKEAGSVARALVWADPNQELPRQMAAATTTWKAMQDHVLAGFHKELEEIGTSLDAIPASATDPDAVARAQSKLTALSVRAAQLRTLPLLDDEARTAIASLAAKIDQRRQGAVATGDVAAELLKVKTAATSAVALKTELETFIAKYPDDARSAEFKRALDVFSAAQSLESWQELVVSYRGLLSPQSGAAATKRAGDVEAFIAAHPDLPRMTEAVAYLDYLHLAADALAEKGTWQNSFSGLLNNPLLTDLQVMEVSDGRRFYTLGPVKRTEHRINNVVSVSFEAIDPKEITKDMSKRLTIDIDPPLTVSERPVIAPHAKVIADLVEDLKTIRENNWDTFGIDFADRLVSNTQMDIVVKAILLQQALKTELTVAGGDYGVGDAYDRILADLGRQNPSEIYWFDNSRVTEGTKKSLTQIMGTLPSSSSVKQRLAAGRAALFAAVAPKSITSGTALRNDAGTWTLFTQASPNKDGALWAIVPSGAAPPAASQASQPAQTPTHLQQVGKAAGGKFVLNDAEMNKLPQGSVIYVVAP